MRKIVALFAVIAILNTLSVSADYELPENIAYYEYCYMTNQCSVPEEIRDIIVMNIFSIQHSQGNLY